MIRTKSPTSTNSNPTPKIVSSPRPVKKRTSSPRLKDVLSAQSSMTSQTMSSRTESTYSVSHSSPGSQEGRPTVALHVRHIDDGRGPGGIIIEEGESQSNHESLNRRDQKNGETKKKANRTLSLNNSICSQGSSRSSLMGDATSERKDSMVSYPKRWPTFEDQSQDQEYLDDQDQLEMEERSEHSDEDKLSPLMDPVSSRLQYMDDRARVTASSHQSVGTSSFSASYGSISLGGDASLSSSDTFNNSPVGATSRLNVTDTIPHKPNLLAQPQKKILKSNPDPNPISWNRQRQRYHSGESCDNQSHYTSASSCTSTVSESASKWEESINSGERLLKRPDRGSTSVSSGDCSIATYSEHDSSCSAENSMPPSKGDCSIIASDPSSDTIGSSIITNSWNLGKSDTAFSVTTEGQQQQKGVDVDVETVRSYSSWTSSDEWSAPKHVQDHWTTNEEFQWKHGSLSEWTSGEDSSSTEGEKKQDENTTKPGKPRSAFDKNAPWYCSEEDSTNESMNDLDSLNSDSSSVLSNLRKKSPPKKNNKKLTPDLDASISFTNLIKPQSISLDNLADAAIPTRKQTTPQDDSMSLDGLLNVSEEASCNKAVLLPTLDEEIFGDALENFTSSIDLARTSARSQSIVASTRGNDTSEDLEIGTTNNNELAPSSQKVLRSRFQDFLKIFDQKWVRRIIYFGLAFFLIFDIALVIILLMR